MTTILNSSSPFADQKLMSISPMIPGFLSILGSYVMIREVVVDLKSKPTQGTPSVSRTLSRTLLAMSIADIMGSFCWVLSTIPSPADIDFLWGNVGTTATCTAQGVIFQISFFAEPTFNVLYAVFSLLMIRCQWNFTNFVRVEPWIQSIVWGVAIIGAIIPIPFEVYNNSGQMCWFSPYPPGCNQPEGTQPEGNVCTRGENFVYFAYPYIMYTASTFFGCVFLMYCIYSSVWKLETRIAGFRSNSILASQRFGFSSQQQSGNMNETSSEMAHSTTAAIDLGADRSESISRGAAITPGGSLSGRSSLRTNVSRRSSRSQVHHLDRKRSRSVREHAYYYLGAFLVAYVLSFAQYVIMLCGIPVPPAMDFFAFVLMPLNGFLNSIVFCHRRPTMHTREGKIFRRLICIYCDRKQQAVEDSSDSPPMRSHRGTSGRSWRSARTSGRASSVRFNLSPSALSSGGLPSPRVKHHTQPHEPSVQTPTSPTRLLTLPSLGNTHGPEVDETENSREETMEEPNTIYLSAISEEVFRTLSLQMTEECEDLEIETDRAKRETQVSGDGDVDDVDDDDDEDEEEEEEDDDDSDDEEGGEGRNIVEANKLSPTMMRWIRQCLSDPSGGTRRHGDFVDGEDVNRQDRDGDEDDHYGGGAEDEDGGDDSEDIDSSMEPPRITKSMGW